MLALIAAGAAQAAGEPWEGGLEVPSAVEQKLHDIVVSNDPNASGFEYICLSPEEWAGVDPPEDESDIWGFVAYEQAPTLAWLAPQTCLGVQRLMLGRNGAKMCQSGERPVYETQARDQEYWRWVKKRKLVKTKPTRVWKTIKVRVKATRVVYVQVQTGVEPLYDVQCADWKDVLFAGQVVAHETIHMYGELNEAAAECYGLQDLAWWVYELSGRDSVFGIEAGVEYAADYAAETINDPVYGSPECRYQGALDQSPENEWPWHPSS
jgi:hypothetical protein